MSELIEFSELIKLIAFRELIVMIWVQFYFSFKKCLNRICHALSFGKLFLLSFYSLLFFLFTFSFVFFLSAFFYQFSLLLFLELSESIEMG